jgi:hypothetical protein
MMHGQKTIKLNLFYKCVAWSWNFTVLCGAENQKAGDGTAAAEIARNYRNNPWQHRPNLPV